MNTPEMHGFSLAQIAQFAGATFDCNQAVSQTNIQNITQDTRQLQAALGSLYVAFKGENHDGHDFLPQAAAQGARAALVSTIHPSADLPQLHVANTLTALQNLGAAWRAQFDLPVVGLTGSNGKTTSKEMIASICRERWANTLATHGNLNNHIGVPLTLCRLNSSHQAAVIEMGASGAGEIALLASMARPHIGLITQAGDAHLEGFGSRAGVARSKGELFLSLPENGFAIINQDDEYQNLWRNLARRTQILSFGLNSGDIFATKFNLNKNNTNFILNTPNGKIEINLAIPGEHNLRNALGAAAVGIAMGLELAEIAAGLSKMQAVKGRSEWLDGINGSRILNDTYNANPSSLQAALILFSKLENTGEKYLVLGQMAELGENSLALHAEAGRAVRAAGFARLYTFGAHAMAASEAFGDNAAHFATHEALGTQLRADLAAQKDALVLIKGSRSSQMDKVTAFLGA